MVNLQMGLSGQITGRLRVDIMFCLGLTPLLATAVQATLILKISIYERPN